jgi:hypothetical protein
MTFGFKRKSKKVLKKRSHRERSRIIKKRTRKFLIKKRHTRKGGMIRAAEEISEDPYAVDFDTENDRYPPRKSIQNDPELNKLIEFEENLPPLDNTKLGFQRGVSTSACILGPDFSQSPEYQALLTMFSLKLDAEQSTAKKAPAKKSTAKTSTAKKMGIKKTEKNDPYEAFKIIKKNIESRSGQVRCEQGPYEIFEFPIYGTQNPLQENKRLKFVVVKNAVGKFIILMAYAYMPNYNYTEEYLLKWTDKMSDGSIRVRTAEERPKKVITITPEIIRDIEAYCRQIGQELEWNSLLMTKSINPDLYKTIIQGYFSRQGDISNTIFLTTINEISHSALPNNFRPPIQRNGLVPLVFLGAEGLFYRNKDGKLCFIICNLSGHFKTPKERMDILRLILKYNYGYVNDDDEIRELEPTPIVSSSLSSSSQESDEPRRPDYRVIITNDPYITTFEEALAILNATDTFPIQGPIHPPYSLI